MLAAGLICIVADKSRAVAAFDLGSFHNSSDFRQRHRTALADRDDDFLQIGDGLNSAQRPHQQFIWPLLIEVAAGRILVTFHDRVFDLFETHPVSQE